MAISRETIRIAGVIRITIDRSVDDTTRLLAERWAEAWRYAMVDWGSVMAWIRGIEADGGELTASQKLRSRRAFTALKATREALMELSQYAGITIIEEANFLTESAARDQLRLIRSQLPDGEAAAWLRDQLVRADPRQIAAVVERTTQQVTTLAANLTDAGMSAIHAELIRGVSRGFGPADVARGIINDLARIERAFNLPLHSALRIARTELLDAHRAAAMVTDGANADVLQGWMWLAQLDVRTCPSCWAQHGTVHDVDESGPDDHPNGRCARMPVVKPWSELGFSSIEEPLSLVPDARAVFDDLNPAEQLHIMGAERLAALQSGDLSWSELTMKRSTDGWRDSWVVKPMRQVRKGRLRVL